MLTTEIIKPKMLTAVDDGAKKEKPKLNIFKQRPGITKDKKNWAIFMTKKSCNLQGSLSQNRVIRALTSRDPRPGEQGSASEEASAKEAAAVAGEEEEAWEAAEEGEGEAVA